MDAKAIAATRPAMKIVPPANLPPRQKKVVQKLILLERYVRISETEGYFHMDTISMESLTEDLSPEDARKPYLAAMAKKKVAGGSESAEDDAAAKSQCAGCLQVLQPVRSRLWVIKGNLRVHHQVVVQACCRGLARLSTTLSTKLPA